MAIDRARFRSKCCPRVRLLGWSVVIGTATSLYRTKDATSVHPVFVVESMFLLLTVLKIFFIKFSTCFLTLFHMVFASSWDCCSTRMKFLLLIKAKKKRDGNSTVDTRWVIPVVRSAASRAVTYSRQHHIRPSCSGPLADVRKQLW